MRRGEYHSLTLCPFGDWLIITGSTPGRVLGSSNVAFNCSITTKTMPESVYDWDQETTVTLTEGEWLDIKCFLINARESETNQLLIRRNRELREKLNNQLRQGTARWAEVIGDETIPPGIVSGIGIPGLMSLPLFNHHKEHVFHCSYKQSAQKVNGFVRV